MSESAIVNPDQAAADDTVEIPRQKLHEFFTRRVLDWWTRKDRSKYKRHVGAQQQLRAVGGLSRSEARDLSLTYWATNKFEGAETDPLPQEEA